MEFIHQGLKNKFKKRLTKPTKEIMENFKEIYSKK
jgi:hypothetical protein